MPTLELIFDWINKNAPMLTIFLMIIMIYYTRKYVIYTLDILREGSRPEIIVYIKKLMADNKDHYQLWFENVGKGTAFNITTNPEVMELCFGETEFIESFGRSINVNNFSLSAKSKIFFPVNRIMIKDLQAISISYQNIYEQPFGNTIRVSHNEIDNRRGEYDSIVEILKEFLSVYDGSRWFLETISRVNIKYNLTESDVKRLGQIDRGIHLIHKEEGDDRLLKIYEELSEHEKNMLFRDLR